MLRGHRIWVSLILDFLASGSTIQEILEDYPQLEEADVLACIAYGGGDVAGAVRGDPGVSPAVSGMTYSRD
ncbi:MAG TPA: DUF433 domain-containing protein [Thermoanaerobaculia bacterium]|nr:DUF433 domain-containing protein [Thermoanaerobaculia bacterium]